MQNSELAGKWNPASVILVFNQVKRGLLGASGQGAIVTIKHRIKLWNREVASVLILKFWGAMGISMKWLIVMGLVMMELESNLLCVNNKKNSLKLKFFKNEQIDLVGTNFWTYCIISEKVEAKTETAKTTVDSLEIEKIDVTVKKTEPTKPTVDSTTSVQPDVTTYKSIASPKQTNEIKTDENNWLPWGECTCDSDDMKLAPFKSRRNRVSGGRVHKNGLIRPKLVVLSDFRTSCDIKITEILEVFCWGWTWKIPYLLVR